MSPAGSMMKNRNKPKTLMTLGVSLMVAFILMEFLIIMGVIPNNSIVLHLVGYAFSTGGMFMAIIGFVTDYKIKHPPQ